MRLSIIHETRYAFDRPMPHALQQLRLSPKDRPFQAVRAWRIEVSSSTIEVEYQDQHANTVTLVSFEPDTQNYTVRCEGVVETRDTNGVTGVHGGQTPLWLFKRATALTRPGKGVRSLAASVRKTRDDIERLHALSAAVIERVSYGKGRTESRTTAEDALQGGHGVCQDHAHIFIAAARTLGYPARYVSGYLAIDGQINQEAGHAWAEAHTDGLGWVGFDISNRISPDERYVRVATGLDAIEAAPITGPVTSSRLEELAVSVQVQEQ
jgi:transglutaminase-like putative cysteine protease